MKRITRKSVMRRTCIGVLILAGAVAGQGAWQAGSAQEQVSALKDHDFKRAIDISADRLEVRTEDNKAIFEGGVEAVQEDLTLKADRVVVHYQSKKPLGTEGGAPAISRIDVAGHVQLFSPSEAVKSEWGVYDLEERLITLGGNVFLERGEAQLQGDRLLVNLDSGVTTLETADTGTSATGEPGRVKGRFVPADGKN
jgi:lipopolysaccharide export system protein LptA